MFRGSALNQDLLIETEKLARSWEQHESDWLRDYLVAGVEDPRLNLQSILTRHFLVRALFGHQFEPLMTQEYRFAAVMTWLLGAAALLSDSETRAALLYALRKKSDNFEGVEIPHFVAQIFATLPAQASGCQIPNYLETLLTSAAPANNQLKLSEQPALDTFAMIWNPVLETTLTSQTLDRQPKSKVNEITRSPSVPRLSVLEPACGSANDYRFIPKYGLARFFDYTGLDLCQKNIDNARALFPGIKFEHGNIFQINSPAKSFDLCFVHDLFEHLSLAGLEQAVEEICRVTRQSVCVGFFQMDEVPEHIVRPRDEYHWNLLSLDRMKRLFAEHGFEARAIHIGTFLSRHTGSRQTHNPNAYTFVLNSI